MLIAEKINIEEAIEELREMNEKKQINFGIIWRARNVIISALQEKLEGEEVE